MVEANLAAGLLARTSLAVSSAMEGGRRRGSGHGVVVGTGRREQALLMLQRKPVTGHRLSMVLT
jgi:hypothetical protein